MVKARYDAVAEFYVEGFDCIDDPASRALLDLVGPVAGLRVLDVACGHGRITRELARQGASVVGIDLSSALSPGPEMLSGTSNSASATFTTM